jgi:hypothetical protein
MDWISSDWHHAWKKLDFYPPLELFKHDLHDVGFASGSLPRVRTTNRVESPKRFRDDVVLFQIVGRCRAGETRRSPPLITSVVNAVPREQSIHGAMDDRVSGSNRG